MLLRIGGHFHSHIHNYSLDIKSEIIFYNFLNYKNIIDMPITVNLPPNQISGLFEKDLRFIYSD